MAAAVRTWLITGVSSGLGRELALAALQRGDTVIGTLRREAQCREFERLAPGRAHARVLDVSDRAAVTGVIEQAFRITGRIDVLVNNAGYGLFGALEEISDAEARQLMETNFFGLMAVIKAALPGLRSKGGGQIVNISSIAGVIGIAGCAVYCASKYAVEGLSESLAKEVAPFNIRVMIVEPGGFRTNFSGASKSVAAQLLPAYEDTPAAKVRARVSGNHGHQPGDPAKAAQAIIAAIDAPAPPLRLLLGDDALRSARGKIETLSQEYRDWEALTTSTKVTDPGARP